MQITATFDSLEEMTTFAKGFISRERAAAKEKEPVTEASVKEEKPITGTVAEEEKPVTEIAAEEEPITEEAPVEEVSAPEGYTLVEVRAALARLSKEGKRTQVQELIQSFGVDKLSAIPAEKYPEVMQKAGEL